MKGRCPRPLDDGDTQLFPKGNFGGARRDRTADLLHAMQALYMVMARIAPERQFGKRVAMPVEVLSRKHTRVTGLYRHRAGMGYIDVALKSFRVDVMVAPDGVHAEDGQYVVADIIQYPSVQARLLCGAYNAGFR